MKSFVELLHSCGLNYFVVFRHPCVLISLQTIPTTKNTRTRNKVVYWKLNLQCMFLVLKTLRNHVRYAMIHIILSSFLHKIQLVTSWSTYNFLKCKKIKRNLHLCIAQEKHFYTPNANMADHSDGPGLVAWKRG